MEREVKIGIAIGVLLIALVAVFLLVGKTEQQNPIPPAEEVDDAALPPSQDPVVPVGTGPGPTPAPPLPGPDGTPTDTVQPAGTPPVGITPVADDPPLVKPDTIYTVQKGDTLYAISKQHYGNGEKWKVIFDANEGKIADPERLIVGTKLVIPDTSRPLTPATIRPTNPGGTPPRTHTVGAGESLRLIAKKHYGTETKWQLIFDANRDKLGNNPSLIKKGVVLVIPPQPQP